MVAAVDTKRVKAVVPMVIQVLKNVDVFTHIYNALCGFPVAMHNYIEEGVTPTLESPQFAKLADVIDPWKYVDRLVNTRKLSINSLGDEFFAPDLSTFAFLEMPGQQKNRHQYYIPNAGHAMNADAWKIVASFNYAVLHNIALPTYTFTHAFSDSGVSIEVRITNGKIPTSVNVWQATNANGRDFRRTTIGNVWTSTSISAVSRNQPTTFRTFVAKPASGYTAVSIELVFDGYFTDKSIPYLKFSTDTFITPNVLPCNYSNATSYAMIF